MTDDLDYPNVWEFLEFLYLLQFEAPSYARIEQFVRTWLPELSSDAMQRIDSDIGKKPLFSSLVELDTLQVGTVECLGLGDAFTICLSRQLVEHGGQPFMSEGIKKRRHDRVYLSLHGKAEVLLQRWKRSTRRASH